MESSGAVVVDLEEFRRRRAAGRAVSTTNVWPHRPWMPVWVWVMVWPA